MITITRMNKIEGSNCKAFFDVIINGIEIKGVKLVEGTNTKELFVSLPREKGKDEQYSNIVNIQDILLKKELEQQIIKTYNS